MRNYLLIDTSNILHILLSRHSDAAIEDADSLKRICVDLHYIDRRCFLVSMETLSVVWLLDSPPYWRQDFEPEYKLRNSGDRSQGAVKIMEYLKGYVSNNFCSLKSKGYEADDIAGLIIKNQPRRSKNYLLTSDSDWMGMIGESTTLLSPVYSPIIRRKPEAFHWLTRHYAKQTKGVQAFFKIPSYTLFRPQDIWRFKSACGDASDNLGPGTLLSLIDLFNPLVELPSDALNSLSDCPAYEWKKSLADSAHSVGIAPLSPIKPAW